MSACFTFRRRGGGGGGGMPTNLAANCGERGRRYASPSAGCEQSITGSICAKKKALYLFKKKKKQMAENSNSSVALLYYMYLTFL